jgi:hypothetical protein
MLQLHYLNEFGGRSLYIYICCCFNWLVSRVSRERVYWEGVLPGGAWYCYYSSYFVELEMLLIFSCWSQLMLVATLK